MRQIELSQTRPTQKVGKVNSKSQTEKLRNEVTLLLRLSFLVGFIILTLVGIIMYYEVTF